MQTMMQQQPFSVPNPPCKPAPPPPSSKPGCNNISHFKNQNFPFVFSRVCTKARTCSETSSESVCQGNIPYKWRIICFVINKTSTKITPAPLVLYLLRYSCFKLQTFIKWTKSPRTSAGIKCLGNEAREALYGNAGPPTIHNINQLW